MNTVVKAFLIYIKESVTFTVLMLGSMTLAVYSFQLGLYLFNGLSVPGLLDSSSLSAANSIPLWNGFLAGREDLLFVFPILILYKEGFKKVSAVLLIISSMIFASGHLYQGFVGCIVKVVYPPLALWYASEKGISRTITGHIINDVTVLGVLKLLAYMNGVI